MIPAYHAARRDRALRGSAIIIYLELLEQLTLNDYTPQKQIFICVDLGYGERTVRRGLKKLTRRGYLASKAGPPGCPREYCLEFRRRIADRPSVAAGRGEGV